MQVLIRAEEKDLLVLGSKGGDIYERLLITQWLACTTVVFPKRALKPWDVSDALHCVFWAVCWPPKQYSL